LEQLPAARELVYLFADELVPAVTRWQKAWAGWLGAISLLVVSLGVVLLVATGLSRTPAGDVLDDLGDLAQGLVAMLMVGTYFTALKYGFLYVERRFPRLTPWLAGDGVSLPSRHHDVEVRKQPLATLLLAVALWSLREQGRVALLTVKQHARLSKRSQWRITVSRPTLVDTPPGHLELKILASLPVGPVMMLKSIIHDGVVPESEDPWGYVVDTVAAGVSDRSRSPAKIASFKAAFDDVAAQWRHFQIHEPELHSALLDECARGIAASTGLSSKRGRSGGGSWGGGDWFDSDDGD